MRARKAGSSAASALSAPWFRRERDRRGSTWRDGAQPLVHSSQRSGTWSNARSWSSDARPAGGRSSRRSGAAADGPATRDRRCRPLGRPGAVRRRQRAQELAAPRSEPTGRRSARPKARRRAASAAQSGRSRHSQAPRPGGVRPTASEPSRRGDDPQQRGPAAPAGGSRCRSATGRSPGPRRPLGRCSAGARPATTGRPRWTGPPSAGCHTCSPVAGSTTHSPSAQSAARSGASVDGRRPPRRAAATRCGCRSASR